MRAESHVVAAAASAGARNLVELLQERAREASKVGATHRGAAGWEEVTWGQILERVKVLSSGLVAQGVKPGDQRVRIQLTSDENRTPITKEEATRVYADE